MKAYLTLVSKKPAKPAIFSMGGFSAISEDGRSVLYF